MDHATASRAGEPFEQLINNRNLLPSIHRRLCTMWLKVRTIERYMYYTYGVTRANVHNVLGIRHDEERRWATAMFEKDCRVEYPLVHSETTNEDVLRFWREMPFDVGVSSKEGNCDLCFLKSKRDLINLIREKPQRADWWIEQEDKMTNRQPRFRSFVPMTFRQMKEIAMSQTEIDLDAKEDYTPISCFCGD